MRLIPIAFGLALAASSNPTFSQFSAGDSEVGPARAQVDHIIEAAKAGAFFANMAQGKIPMARHLLSGLTCQFEPNSKDNQIQIYSGLPPGFDVACQTSILGFIETDYATKFAVTPTLDQAFEKYNSEIKQLHPDVKVLSGAFVARPMTAHSPPRRTIRMTFACNGVQCFSRLSVTIINGWMIEQRFTGPLDQATLGDAIAETSLSRIVADVAKGGDPNPKKAPTPDGGLSV